jgi:hypothetical protein
MATAKLPIDFYRKVPTTPPEYYTIKVTDNNQQQTFKTPVFGIPSHDT